MQFAMSLFTLINSITSNIEEKPFVLIELFTSEDCSSCPLADRMSAEIVDGEEGIGLSFHYRLERSLRS